MRFSWLNALLLGALAAKATTEPSGYIYVIPLNSAYGELPMPTTVASISHQGNKILFSHMLRTFKFLSHDVETHFGKHPVWLHPSIRGSVRENVGVNTLITVRGVDSPTDILRDYVPAFHLQERLSINQWKTFTDRLVQDVWDRYGGSWKVNYDNGHGGSMDSVVEYPVILPARLSYPLILNAISKVIRIFNRVYGDLNSTLFNPKFKEDGIFMEEVEYIARTINAYSWSVYNLTRYGPDFLNFNVIGLELIHEKYGSDSPLYIAAKSILNRLFEQVEYAESLSTTVIPYIQSTYSYRNTVTFVLNSAKTPASM
ncbi:hypothetical protein K493DRAFT_382226 [Basidiobolus meristosporus CBS 931.73]|uniref:Vacuolar sorting protein Vps3844 N-terminal domain-containing protein n=1 Tax=Basidiobolus meristosporus CBS 931.73 TaxID=1314790 RepID=A0A1Y1XVG2_9FUNG|nr:hypothetical protein K493DRAFT_382226 [Basidiobolus meristosporus CBS 931.73]|eukprot:ORX89713.1 hypothetical protein K493DRAFT_382226 [Basidiobolus meristosporus CBS 931.73]